MTPHKSVGGGGGVGVGWGGGGVGGGGASYNVKWALLGLFHCNVLHHGWSPLQPRKSLANTCILYRWDRIAWCVGKTLVELFIYIIYIYNNFSLTSSREPLYNPRRIPYDIWLSNRRTPLFVADEYHRKRIYFRYWEHCLFHWCSCKYLLHICLLFCLILSCKRYKHMHSYFMTLQIYSICNTYPTPPSWTYRIIQNCE